MHRRHQFVDTDACQLMKYLKNSAVSDDYKYYIIILCYEVLEL